MQLCRRRVSHMIETKPFQNLTDMLSMKRGRAQLILENKGHCHDGQVWRMSQVKVMGIFGLHADATLLSDP